MKNIEIFTNKLEETYKKLFREDINFKYVSSKMTPRALAERIATAILIEEMPIGQIGIKIACRELGIKHDKQSILNYIEVE